MSAYAALVTLLRLLESIIPDAGDGLFSVHNRDQLQSFVDNVRKLLKILDASNSISEARTTDAGEPSSTGITALSEERTRDAGEPSSTGITASLEERMRKAALDAEDLIEARNMAILDSDARRLLAHIINMVFHFFFFCPFLVFSNRVPVSSQDSISEPFVLQVFVPALTTSAVCCAGVYLVLVVDNFLDLADSRERLTHGLSNVLKELISIIKEAGDSHGRESAREALLSLEGILESAFESGVPTDNKSELQSIHEKVKLLIKIFPVNAPTHMVENTKAAVSAAERIMDQSERKSFRRLMKFMLLVLLSCVSALAMATIPFLVQLVAGWVIFVILVFAVLALCTSASDVWDAITSRPAQENRQLNHVIDDLSIIVQKVESSSSHSSPEKDNLGGKVVGLEGDIYDIKDRHLCDHSSKRKVVSIVGMGGIGKTTLATQVYNDAYVVEFFDIRAWVTISQEYSRSDVLLGLLKSLKVQMQDKDKEDPGTSLHKMLYGRRYLIVMDDVWDTEILDFLSRCFPDNGNGSRVLLTSRLSAVANRASSGSHIHEMRCLDEGLSWQLLRETVFGERDCPSELVPIGEKIAKGCGGLPLAILVIGGVLPKEVEESRIWDEVAENLESGEIQEQCLEILGMSYKHLPHHLRPFFLYFGVFLGDSEISVSRLINLWIAEGFLKQSLARSMKEEAEGYLKELVDRNLILECTKSCDGRVKTYDIHDLLRDLCVENARKENFFLAKNVSSERPQHAVRRLSIQSDALRESGPGSISSYPNLRSFFLWTAIATPASSRILHCQSRLYLYFRYLRVLDVLVLHFGECPAHIVSLVCLRYLAVNCDGPLPLSMSKLRNLETLVHHHGSLEVYPFLPRVIWDMPNLRYIYVKPGCYLSDPRRVNPFRWKGGSIVMHLQTLVGIRNFKWSKDIITRIPNLKKLGISYHVSSSVDWSLMYELESLAALQQLESLKIVIEYDHDGASTIFSGPPKLMFPRTLKKLSLSGGRIAWDSFGSLQNLEVLKLRNEECSDSQRVKVEVEFPKLRFLLLENMGFTSWEPEEDCFPRLERLVVKKCWMLEEIPFENLGYIPTLETVELDDCPYADSIAYYIQQEQREMGTDIKVLIKW